MRFSSTFRPQLSLDLGSTQTKVILNNSLVWHQPTLLAWHTQQQAVIAVGDEAAALRGKIPGQIKLINPVQDGIVAELDFTQWYLKVIKLHLLQKKLLYPWSFVSCKATVPAYISPLEKLQFKQLLRRAGWSGGTIIAKAAAFSHLGIFRKTSQTQGVIDWGGETAEVAVISGTSILATTTFKSLGSNQLTKVIKTTVARKYDLKISQTTAEKIKKQLGDLNNNSPREQKITIRGKHLQKQTVMTVRIDATIFQAEFYQLSSRLLLDIKHFIATLPLGVITLLQEQGFYLTGGGSQLAGWEDLVQKELVVPTTMAKTPTLDLVKGLERDGKS